MGWLSKQWWGWKNRKNKKHPRISCKTIYSEGKFSHLQIILSKK